MFKRVLTSIITITFLIQSTVSFSIPDKISREDDSLRPMAAARAGELELFRVGGKSLTLANRTQVGIVDVQGRYLMPLFDYIFIGDPRDGFFYRLKSGDVDYRTLEYGDGISTDLQIVKIGPESFRLVVDNGDADGVIEYLRGKFKEVVDQQIIRKFTFSLANLSSTLNPSKQLMVLAIDGYSEAADLLQRLSIEQDKARIKNLKPGRVDYVSFKIGHETVGCLVHRTHRGDMRGFDIFINPRQVQAFKEAASNMIAGKASSAGSLTDVTRARIAEQLNRLGARTLATMADEAETLMHEWFSGKSAEMPVGGESVDAMIAAFNDPKYVAAIKSTAKILGEIGNPKAAQPLAEKARELLTLDSPSLEDLVAIAYAILQLDSDLGMEITNQILAKYPNDAGVHDSIVALITHHVDDIVSEPDDDLKKTVLYDEHIGVHGATMAGFGGWNMPLHYGDAAQENLNTRRGVSIFDESHMGLIDLVGDDTAMFIDWISSPNVNRDGRIRKFKDKDVQYRFLLDDKGNIIDDIQVIKLESDHFRLIVNAGNTDKAREWITSKIKEVRGRPTEFNVVMRDLRNAANPNFSRIILALQGPMAQRILESMASADKDKEDIRSLGYFKVDHIDITMKKMGGKIPFTKYFLIQRTGYTGEDGFEIHLHPDDAIDFWRAVIALGAKPAGLQARDSLRLEAGLPLYGHEWDQADEAPMPYEYKYGWALNTSHRVRGNYIGKRRAIAKKRRSNKKLVGVRILDDRSQPYNGDKVFDLQGKEIGYVTSGVFSPNLKAGIGLVYVDKAVADIGTEIRIEIAGSKTPAKVVKTPFINNIVSDRGIDYRERAPFYIPGGDEDRAKKLAVIKKAYGVDTVDGLYGDLQEDFYAGDWDLPEELDPETARREIFRLMSGLSLENDTDMASFLGAGTYDEPISDLVAYLIGMPEFFTSYTPYQPEVSQGNLRLIYLYQSIMAKLLDMEVVNASLYDGANAFVEGVRMACSAMGRKKVIVAGAINPFHRMTLDTHVKNSGIEVIYINADKETGRIDVKALRKEMDESVASIVMQQPNFLGELETEIPGIAEIVKANKALLHIHSNDPVVFSQIKSPGSYGADIVTAEGQAFVGKPYYGGNNLGIMACKRKLINFMPGRLVGQTTDDKGETALVLALTHREQHVAREDAPCNICTNAALNAMAAAVNIAGQGKSEIDMISIWSHQFASTFAEFVDKLKGFSVFSSGPIVREVVVKSPIPIDELQRRLQKKGINAGFDVSKYFSHLGENLIQFSFTRTNTTKELRALLEALTEIAEGNTEISDQTKEKNSFVIPDELKRDTEFDIPVISDPVLRKVLRRLADQNYNPVDNPYPLGSCTMMWNPIVHERIVGFDGFAKSHPYGPEDLSQGTLQMLYELGIYLKDLTGMDDTSLHPSAGAHGEFTGLTTIMRYHENNGDHDRKVIITTDAAHGTNPATSAMTDGKVEEVKTDEETGRLNLDSLKEVLAKEENRGKVAAIMLTAPNTVGLFDDLKEAARLVQEAGGLVYMDGANLNSIIGRIRPGDLGVDVLHINLHKTFSAPHGGGGPGSGPICVKSKLAKFLPRPRIVKKAQGYRLDYDVKDAIKIGTFLGNIPVSVRAYAYIRTLGVKGLRQASGDAVLNANYLMARLKDHFDIPYAEGELRMHEFVISVENITKDTSVTANDFAKRLQDYGIHPPTTYFPQIVHEALMFEPTQSMSLADLDRIAGAMIAIKKEAYGNTDLVKSAPHITPVARVDVHAAQQTDVALKASDIAAILDIGEAELSQERETAVIETLYDYEDPFKGWSADPDESEAIESGEWSRIVQDGKFAVVGLTAETIKLLSGVSKVVLPAIGAVVSSEEVCGSLQTDKATFEVFSPVAGKVVSVNKFVTADATDVNEDPYGRGWLFMVELDESVDAGGQGKASSAGTAKPPMQVTQEELEATDRLNGMTILRFSHGYDGGGGIQRHLQFLNRTLLERNNMTIIQMYMTTDEQALISYEDIGKGKLVRVPIHTTNIYGDDPSGVDDERVRVLDKANELFAQHHIDLVMIHSLFHPHCEPLARAAKRKGLKVLMQHHEGNDMLREEHYPELIGLADGIGGVTGVDIPGILRKRFDVLFNGVDTEFFQPDLDIEEKGANELPTVLVPASICERKNQIGMVRIIDDLRKRSVKAKYIFAGKDHILPGYDKELHELINELGLRDLVEFKGEVSSEELKRLYQEADLIALPTTGEGLPRVIIEAQSMGKPVVVYDVDGVSQAMIGGYTGYLVRLNDESGFADAIEELASDKALRELIGGRGRNFAVTTFSLPIQATRHEKFYLKHKASSAGRLGTYNGEPFDLAMIRVFAMSCRPSDQPSRAKLAAIDSAA
ncbi:aminomethyl-transferring glycine dehydrogenase subunit GcvPB [Candidatus Omnitrophota bacterium]